MRCPILLNRLITTTVVWAVASQAYAQDGTASRPPPRFSAEVSMGAEYDSNVSVDELDASSSESDYALTLGAEVGVEQQVNDTVELGLSYDLSQSSYAEFDQVDRQTHILGADVELELGAVDSAVSLFYINSRLDSKSFLELYRLSPSISGFLGKRWFARGAYVYSEKSIAERPERDSRTNAGEADLYFFYQGLRKYFNFGYRYKSEDAVADQLDFISNSFKVRYVQRVEIGPRPAKVELGWRYEDRNYRSITPDLGTQRSDTRQRLQLDVEIPLLQKAAVQVYVAYGDFDSNLEVSNYDQTIVGSRFLYRW